MSKDNYLNFGKHEIPIHVYRIRKSLKGLSKAQKIEMLSKEHFIFVGESNSKANEIDSRILVSDTLGDILHKIAIHCCLKEVTYTGTEIFAWLDLNKGDIPSLHKTVPLGIYHEHHNGKHNPFTETSYDDHFVKEDGTPKRDPKSSMQMTRILSDVLAETGLKARELKIYFTTIHDYIDYVKDINLGLSEGQLFNGLLRKYWPNQSSLKILLETPGQGVGKREVLQRRKCAETIVHTLHEQKTVQEKYPEYKKYMDT